MIIIPKSRVGNTLLIVLIFVQLLFSMEISITDADSQTAQQLADRGYDVVGKFEEGVRVVVSDKELEDLKKEYSVVIRESDEELLARVKKAMGKDSRALSVYPSYDEYVADLQQLQSQYPELCQVTEVGKSRGMLYYEATGSQAYKKYNQALWLIKVSDNVHEDEDEPGYMVLGEHHSREPSSLHVSMYILKWLLKNYGTNDEATAFVNNKQIWFMPLVNPNGYTVVYEELNGMMRKNICDNNNNKTVDITEWGQGSGNTADGVDLNRNYSVGWGTSGVSHSPGQSTYCGKNALSEPEVACVARVIDSLPNVLGEMSYHSYSQVVLYSPAYDANAILPNAKALKELGAQIAGKTKKKDNNGYYGHGTPQEAIGYSASGGLMDYAFIELGIFGYCGELGTKFVQTEKLDIMGANNLEGIKEMFWRDEYATISGHAQHKVTGTPVPGRIIIEEVDDAEDERYRSSDAHGSYWRFTSPGTYTVTFIPDADSLEDKTVSGVVVSYDSVTTIDFIYPQEVATISEIHEKSGFTIQTLNKNVLSISSPENAITEVSVLSLKGQLIKKVSPESLQENLTLELSNAKGIYLLNINTTKGLITRRIML